MVLTKFFKQPTTAQRFKLLRNFSWVSLSAFLLTTAWLAVFYRHQAVQDLVALTEDNNVALTQVFANTVWPEYGEFLSSTQNLTTQQLVRDPRIQEIQREIIAQFEGLSVVKIKVYDLSGRTVFSTSSSQIGIDKGDTSGFLTAKSGEVVSQLGHRDTFQALQDTIEDRDLLSSYLPIYADNSRQEVVGVFELYTDVTPLLAKVNQAQRAIILGSLLSLAALYGILYLFMRRADYLLKTQYEELQGSEHRYRQQASELERVLDELQTTQSQAIHSEKMSSLGQLVAGVAHEINNPVSFIHGNLAHVQDYANSLMNLVHNYQHHYPQPVPEIEAAIEETELEFMEVDLPKLLGSMKMGSDRIREIVLSLRNFSRLDEAGIKRVDLHEGIENTLVILNHRLKATPDRPEIIVIKQFAPLPPVACYAGSLNQVFMNILANAIDAIEGRLSKLKEQGIDNYVPTLTLTTELINKTEVKIAVSDNGIGMPAQVHKRMFEPFFTTKAIGKGTGMGMSISYQIITERHGGKLNCISTPNKGTTFFVHLPINQAA